MYSKYAWSRTVRTCGGTRSKYASSSARVFVVPVGLFGAAMKTSFVRGVIASSIASRSKRSSRERHAHGDAAELQRVEDVARERRPAGDDLVARVERRQADVADDRVRAGADGHLLEADAVPLGERAPEAPRAAVRVAVELERRALDRLLRGRERPVRPLVRGELDDALEPELALDLLDRLARLVRDEPVERGADRATGRRRPGRSAHVAGSWLRRRDVLADDLAVARRSSGMPPRPLPSRRWSATASDGGEDAGRDEPERDVRRELASRSGDAAFFRSTLQRLQREVADGAFRL